MYPFRACDEILRGLDGSTEVRDLEDQLEKLSEEGLAPEDLDEDDERLKPPPTTFSVYYDDHWLPALKAVLVTPARSLAAKKEKARLLKPLIRDGVLVFTDDTFEERARPHDLLALSLADDTLSTPD